MYSKTLLFFLMASVFRAFCDESSTCVCSTVPCPEAGENTIIMGNGNAKMTYVYEIHNNHPIVISAIGELTQGSLNEGTGTTDCTRKYSRMLEDDGYSECDAGHILANRLGGYGNQPLNIFPQNSTINQGVFAQFEGDIYECMEKANNGVLEWEFMYENCDRTMPDKVKYSATFDQGCEPISKLFDNK